jgi:hypothetical protein
MVGILAMGVTLLVAGWHTRQRLQPIAGGVTATGRVTAVRVVSTGKGHVYAEVVTFTDASGRTFAVTGPTSSDYPRVGASARVSYDPANPNRACDLSASSTAWLAPFVTGIVILSTALVVLLIVTIAIQRTRRRRATHAPSTDLLLSGS